MTPNAPSRFNPRALSKIIEETVPPTRRHAVVGTVNDEGVSIVAKFQFMEHENGNAWTLDFVVERDWGGDISGEAKVVWSW